MNQESVFALRFVVKDLAKIKKSIDTVNKQLKKLEKQSQNASKSVDKVQTSFGKATRAALRFAAAYFTVSKVVGSVFSKATESIQIEMMANSAGVAADKVERLGKALKRYGGDARSAGSAYASLTDIIGGATHGMGISQDVQRVNSMFGIGFNYGNISQDQLITEIATAMHRLRGNKDQWGINQIAKAYGIDSSMANLLAEKGASWNQFVSGFAVTRASKSETERLLESQQKLQDAYDRFIRDITPLLTEIVDLLAELTPILKGLVKVVEAPFKLGDAMDRASESIVAGTFDLFGMKYNTSYEQVRRSQDPKKMGYTARQSEWLKKNRKATKGNEGLILQISGGAMFGETKDDYRVYDKNMKEILQTRDYMAAIKAFYDEALKAKGMIKETPATQNNTTQIQLVNNTGTDFKVGNTKTTSGSITVAPVKYK